MRDLKPVTNEQIEATVDKVMALIPKAAQIHEVIRDFRTELALELPDTPPVIVTHRKIVDLLREEFVDHWFGGEWMYPVVSTAVYDSLRANPRPLDHADNRAWARERITEQLSKQGFYLSNE